MLVPAILYKTQIIIEFQKKLYTKDMFYGSGGIESADTVAKKYYDEELNKSVEAAEAFGRIIERLDKLNVHN